MSDRHVAAVLTAHNRRAQTLACLRTLERQRPGGWTLRTNLVDDASSDGTADAVRREFADVRVLSGDGSLFWGGGMRLALAEAIRDGWADAVLWLNDDVQLDLDALPRLLATLDDLPDPERSIVAGSMRDPATGHTTYGGVRRCRTTRPMRFELVEPRGAPVEVETMNGNCVLVPAPVVRAVGNIDARFSQKMGDFDYGLRARAQGCSVWIAPGTVGACATHPQRSGLDQPLLSEIRRMFSTKELPPLAWARFTSRWAGPLWPAYWASPYALGLLRLITERVAVRAAPRRAGAARWRARLGRDR